MSRGSDAVFGIALLLAGALAGLLPAPAFAVPDGAWIEMAPPARSGHVAVFDSLANRLVTYDRGTSGAVWVLQLGTDAGWTKWTPEGAAVPGGPCAAALDRLRDRVLVVFASDGNGSLDLWSFDLERFAWERLEPSGAAPEARDHVAAILDPRRDRLVVHGGSSGYSEVWAFDLAAMSWSLLQADGPDVAGESVIHDPVRDRMVAFAGASDEYSGGHRVWAFSLGSSTWTEIVPAAPLHDVVGAATVYDPVGDRLLVVGGQDVAYLHGGWPLPVMALALAGTPGWSEIAESPARMGNVAVYDSRAHRALVHGGSAYGSELAGALALSLGGAPAWSVLPGGVPPTPRAGHAAAWDGANARMIVYGGHSGTPYAPHWSYPADVGSYASEGWQGALPGGGVGTYPSLVYDAGRQRMIAFGGNDGSTASQATMALALSGAPAWSPLAPGGPLPPGRSAHVAVVDPLHDRMIVFGGSTGTTSLNDVWALPLDGAGPWQQLFPAGTPPSARCYSAGVYDPVRSRLVVFGGTDGAWRSDAWALSLTGPPAWSPIVLAGEPEAVPYPRGAYDPDHDQVVILGQSGTVDAVSLGDVPAWRDLVITGPHAFQYNSSLCYDPVMKRMLVFGGGGAYGQFFEDTWAIQLGQPAVAVPPATAATAVVGPPVPNPSAALTRLSFTLARPGPFEVRLLDVTGREVRSWREGWVPAGARQLSWDGRDASGRPVPAGVYLARVRAGGTQAVRRIVRIR